MHCDCCCCYSLDDETGCGDCDAGAVGSIEDDDCDDDYGGGCCCDCGGVGKRPRHPIVTRLRRRRHLHLCYCWSSSWN